MSAFEADAFSFPISEDFVPYQYRENKICVVSVVGKSPLKSFTSKASALNPILDAEVFKGVKDYLTGSINQGDIECFYDVDSNVVYLHHSSPQDTHRLTAVCQRLKDSPMKDFQSLWQQEDCHYAKCFLFLFHVSHILVISHPGSSFDITYVRLFRILDNIRMKVQKCVCEQILDLNVSKDWKYNGRPCSPRVLFAFETSTIEYHPDDLVENTGYRARPQRIHPIKRLQHCMEDQIYKILRKSRVITNISNNSLFAVPANQEFVFIHVYQNEAADPVSFFLQQIREQSLPQDADSPRKSYQATRRGQTGEVTERSRSSVTSKNGGGDFSFKEFLWQHIETALTKGFDDNVGRHPVTATFELASSETWFNLANKLHAMFFSEKLDPKIQPHCNTLKSLLETDLRFSENRCNKVLPVAESSYQENLPTHYVTNYHLSKLAQAKKVFSQFARGPACDKYLKQLEESCERFWKNGRQLCEEISLTGNHCVNPLHRTEDDMETDMNSHLPTMPHSSQLKMKAACNCGRKQADKEDPFTHKAANYDFYQKLEEQCCNKLEHYNFPVFEPSSTEVRAAFDAIAALKPKSQPSKLTQKESVTSMTNLLKDSGTQKGDASIVTQGIGTLSLALSLGQSGASDMYVHGGQSNCSPVPDHETSSNPDQSEAPNSPSSPVSPAPLRQHSTTEYLPGMIHTESHAGLLPKFPSWSLVCVGKSTLYNHNQGLDLPGFLSGSNFLLPWDITVQAERDKWPTVGETSGKKGKQKKGARGKELTEVNLRVYIGEEYECPRGHRFFCSGPEKIIKVSSTSTVKDNANKLVNLDMPLYCPCHCRSSKGYMAQMMRLYIVTPDGPLRVSVNPLVQPAPHPCPIFHPGVGEEVDLTPGSLWVLRLPSVYIGDQGPYTMPTDATLLPACRLLKGTFNFKEMGGD